MDHLPWFLCRLKASQLELGLIVASMLVPEGPEPEHRVLTGHPDAPRAQERGCRSPPAVRGLSLGPGPAGALSDVLSFSCVGVARKLTGAPSPGRSSCISAPCVLVELRSGSLLLMPGGTSLLPWSPGCSTPLRAEAALSEPRRGTSSHTWRWQKRLWHAWLCPRLTFSCSWAFLVKSEFRFCHI